MTRILALNEQSIIEAASILRGGGLVGMPTETVYGLAANACDGVAVAKIFAAKGRPQFNPLIVHVNDLDAVAEFAHMSVQDEVIAQKFWPGALTLILKCKENCALSDLVSAGLPTVAVRIPSHKGARALIKACGFPIAAPSANKSGSLSPTTPAHVAQSLGMGVDLILADGACAVGLESTVVDCTGDRPYVLRPGGVTAEDLSEALGEDVGYSLGGNDKGESVKSPVKSPGQLLKHYAPSIPVRLNAIDLEEGEALLSFGSIKFMGVKGAGAASDLSDDMVQNLSKEGDLYEAAANLFAMMRALDKPEHKAIAVMNIPDNGIGVAINDRLKRAANS
ncbi:MAG: threonylcarbamoyl-AMP synthase [Zetaproteobacteria bacterium]|nr:MAG: threonylcarbamoyl-AMP synthase [Zetaproteobacteria bacterium]